MTIYPPAKRYTMNYGEYLEIGKRRGWRVANHYVDIYDRLMGTGSYLRPETDYATRVTTPAPVRRDFTPSQLAKLDALLDHMAIEIPGLMKDEPDGTQFYEYTIEARYGVPVGCEWRPTPCRAIVVYKPPVERIPPTSTLQPVISLFHSSMLCEGAAA